VRKRLARGKHRTEVTEATEGMIGTEAVREVASGDTTASVRKRLARGKHRTEATEGE